MLLKLLTSKPCATTFAGPGKPQDKEYRVFNAFDRLGRETGSTEGTGIGLVLTKRIIEAMHGNVGFESKDGVGGAFWVELPQDVSHIAEKYRNNFTDSQIAVLNEQSNLDSDLRTVLHIEDNPLNLRLMRQILSKHK